MSIRPIAEYLGDHPFFAGLDTASIQELAGCARNEHFRAGEYLFREGGDAERFYVIMNGRVALELSTANSGPHVLESAGEGEVLDWPWLIPPHRWLFDARAVEPTRVISLESACLRGKYDADPRLGYEFAQRVAQVMSYRLMATGCGCSTFTAPRSQPGPDRWRPGPAGIPGQVSEARRASLAGLARSLRRVRQNPGNGHNCDRSLFWPIWIPSPSLRRGPGSPNSLTASPANTITSPSLVTAVLMSC